MKTAEKALLVVIVAILAPVLFVGLSMGLWHLGMLLGAEPKSASILAFIGMVLLIVVVGFGGALVSWGVADGS